MYHLYMAQRMAKALDVLYFAIDTDGPAPLVADTTVWLAHITPTLDASLGAIDALIASGRMAVVEDPELTRRLAGLRGRVEDAVEEHEQALDIHSTQVLPEFDDLDHQATRHISDTFWSQERVPGRELEYRGEVVYPGGATLLAALNIRHTLYTVTIGELRGLAEELDLAYGEAQDGIIDHGELEGLAGPGAPLLRSPYMVSLWPIVRPGLKEQFAKWMEERYDLIGGVGELPESWTVPVAGRGGDRSG